MDIELDVELHLVAKYKLKEVFMISKEIGIKIEKAIKEIWLKNIPKNFSEGYIINEDCLKWRSAITCEESCQQS